MTRDQTILEQLPQIWSFYRSLHTPTLKKTINSVYAHTPCPDPPCTPAVTHASPYAPLVQTAHLLGKEMGLRGLQVVIAQLAVFRESKRGSNE
jgi:hypothetical protein